MASLGRMIGKAAKAVAPLAQASALESMRNEFQKERDATLQQYGKENTAANQEYQTSERVAGEQAQSAENDKNRGLEERRINISKGQLDQNRLQAKKVSEQIDQELEIGKYKLDEAKVLKDIQTQIIATEDPAEQQSLYEKFLNIQGKEPDNKFSFIRVQGEDFEPDTLVRGNTRSGAAERINLDDVEEADPLGIR